MTQSDMSLPCNYEQIDSNNQDNNCNQQTKKPTNDLIIVINYLLVLGLAIQVFLTLYVLILKRAFALNRFNNFFDKRAFKLNRLNNFFDKYAFHLSDWAINTPPIFGVLANLVSFSLLLARSDGDMSKVFGDYFFEAVTTTLIGGIFYTINLALKIIIHPSIEKS
jgi:hypothetical protein